MINSSWMLPLCVNSRTSEEYINETEMLLETSGSGQSAAFQFNPSPHYQNWLHFALKSKFIVINAQWFFLFSDGLFKIPVLCLWWCWGSWNLRFTATYQCQQLSYHGPFPPDSLKKLRQVPKPLTTLECERSKISHPKWLTINTSWGPTCSWATFIPLHYLQIHRNQNLPPIHCWASKENNNYQLMSRQ